MRVTPGVVRATYEFLRQTMPFHRWKLPPAETLRFVVSASASVAGYFRAPDTLCVNDARVDHTQTLVVTMAHEMVHLAVYMRHPKERGEHGANFRRMWAQVARHHGFDEAYR